MEVGADRQLADVAVTNGVITAVGEVDGSAARTVDAEGHLVLPGWVDVHTPLRRPSDVGIPT